MSETNATRPSTNTYFFTREANSSFPRIRFRITPNDVAKSFNFVAETEEPLSQTQIEELKKMLTGPRVGPPPNDATFELLKHDIERHGFANALVLHGIGEPNGREVFCDGPVSEHEDIEDLEDTDDPEDVEDLEDTDDPEDTDGLEDMEDLEDIEDLDDIEDLEARGSRQTGGGP